MSTPKACLFLFVCIALLLFSLSCKPKGESKPLDEKNSTYPQNYQCVICHEEFATEEISVVHAQTDIWCVGCHGTSQAHIADEGNLSPPDIMFAVEDINPSCIECHVLNEMEVPAHDIIAGGTNDRENSCTYCHGSHSLSR